MVREGSNDEDILDSRDVIERFEELEAERAALAEAVEEAGAEVEASDDAGILHAQREFDDARDDLREWDGENRHELDALREFIDEGSDEWRHGETLIRESYFEDYARELADDIGAVSGNESWPLTCIDWERAARELRMDYTSADFDGITYYYRS